MKTRIYEGEALLRGKRVFLSASKPSRRPKAFPVADETEIEEGVRCLARAVFAEGGHLVFGAHPSISPLIVDVATEYFEPRWNAPETECPVTIYQSEVFRDVIPAATRELERQGYARIEMTGRQNGEVFDPAHRDREQCLASLAHMRERMFRETEPAAMVAIGGMEGVIREARLFLEMFERGKVYVMTSLGGASSRLADYLGGNLLDDGEAISVPGWQQRLIPIESVFAVPEWAARRESHSELPAQPYALLMQDVVRDIGTSSTS